MTVGDTQVSLELAQARSSGHGWAKATGLRQGTISFHSLFILFWHASSPRLLTTNES